MNSQEFASSIRAKYPGPYDHVDDETLARKVVEKYPIYADRVSFDASPTGSPGMDTFDAFSKAAGMTPMGMAAQGSSSIAQGFGKVLDTTGVPVPDAVASGAKKLFGASRALGVGVANQAAGFLGGKPQSQTVSKTLDALKPGYEPQGFVDKAGAAIGENAPVVAASIASPGIGGPLSMMAQQAQTGKVSPLPLLGPASEGVKSAVGGKEGISRAATKMARRSIGYPKTMLGNTFARGQAADAAKIALDNDVIPWTGNPQTILSRAGDLANKSGSKLGEMRDSVGPQDIGPVFEQLDALRNKLTQGGARGGQWDLVHSKIDEAKNALKGLNKVSNAKPLLQSVEAAKKRIGGGLNYNADLNSQEDTKGISRAIESGIEQILRDNGIDMKAYKGEKRTYGGAKSIFKAANKEVAGQEGNKIGRLSMFGTISDLVSRRLPGTIARTLHEAPKAVENVSPNSAIDTLPTQNRILSEAKAREYFQRAGKDKKKAREMAISDGWMVR